MPSSVDGGMVVPWQAHQMSSRMTSRPGLSHVSAVVLLAAVGLVAPACGDAARPFGNNPDAGASAKGGGPGPIGGQGGGGLPGSGGLGAVAGRAGSGGAASGFGGALSPGGMGGSSSPDGKGGAVAGAGGGPATGGRSGSGGANVSGGAGGGGGSGGASAGAGGAAGRAGAGAGGRGGGAGVGGITGSSCQELAKQYEGQLSAAKECTDLGPGTQCQMEVPSSLDCGIDCKTVVNDSRALGTIYDTWKAAGCAPPATCAQIQCIAVDFGHCDPDSASKTKYRCNDTAAK